MRASVLILITSVTYTACATRADLPSGRTPGRGGTLRVYLEGDWPPRLELPGNDLERFVAAATGLGLLVPDDSGEVAAGVAVDWGRDDAAGSAAEWWFDTSAGATFAGGQEVTPRDVVESLTAAAALEASPGRWLLAPVVGARSFVRGEVGEIQGLVPGSDTVRVQLVRETPDLAQRLSHPALRIWTAGSGAGPVGPGPFEIAAERLLVASPLRAEEPYLDRIEVIASGDVAPVGLARLGEIDAAVIYGRSVSAFLEAEEGSEPRFNVSRLSGWDRTYVLWLAPGLRWTQDPGFRRWLDATLDRPAMLRYLFDDRGGTPCDLLGRCGDATLRIDEPTPWRVPRGVRPTVALALVRSDRLGGEIAARIKADLESAGVGVEIEPRSRDDLDRGIRRGEVQAALLYRTPWTSDPVLTLLGTLYASPEGLQAEIAALDRAAGLPIGSDARREAAEEVHKRVLSQGRIVPVVRLDAWVATTPGLVLAPGGPASLDVAHAGWLP